MIIGLVIVLILFLVVFVDLRVVVDTLRQTDWRLIPLAVAFLLAGNVLLSVRLRYLMNNEPPLLTTFQDDSICYMLNILIHIPAPATRVVAISRNTPVTMPQVTSAVVVERLLEQVMRLTALVLSLALLTADPANASASILRSGLTIVVAIILILLLVRYGDRLVDLLAPRLGKLPRVTEAQAHDLLTRLLGGLAVAASPRQLIVGLLLSFVMWSAYFLFQYVCLLALHVPLPTIDLLALSMAVLAVAPPSAPAMAGIYHGVVIATLSISSLMDQSTITAYAILLHAVQMGVWVILGTWSSRQVDLQLGKLVAAARRPPAGAEPNHP